MYSGLHLQATCVNRLQLPDSNPGKRLVTRHSHHSVKNPTDIATSLSVLDLIPVGLQEERNDIRRAWNQAKQGRSSPPILRYRITLCVSKNKAYTARDSQENLETLACTQFGDATNVCSSPVAESSIRTPRLSIRRGYCDLCPFSATSCIPRSFLVFSSVSRRFIVWMLVLK